MHVLIEGLGPEGGGDNHRLSSTENAFPVWSTMRAMSRRKLLARRSSASSTTRHLTPCVRRMPLRLSSARRPGVPTTTRVAGANRLLLPANVGAADALLRDGLAELAQHALHLSDDLHGELLRGDDDEALHVSRTLVLGLVLVREDARMTGRR